MSRQTIQEKSVIIRNETQPKANTRKRVADVIDDLNETKADQEFLEAEIAYMQAGMEAQGDLINDVRFTQHLQYAQIDSLETKVAQKLNKPTTTVTDTSTYTHAVLVDSNGNSAKYLAGDLGKNVANSSLTSISGAGLTLGANWSLNTSGFYYSIAGLPDTSNDATFNTILSQNAAGRVGKTNGKKIFTDLPSQLTEVERNAWKTNMNGGWTTATMSVAMISPPVIDQQDKPYWINLKGTNLNLPPANFKLEICTGSSATADTATVVAEIPSSQVQLYTNGIDLTFYYNFKDLPIGQYKIRIWNGVAWYLTNLTINVVDHIERVNLNNILWSKKIYNDATSSAITESGSTVSYNSDGNVKPPADDSTFIAGRKTNQLVGADEDFYMTVEVTGKTAVFNGASGWGSMVHFIGLVDASIPVDLLNQTLVNVRLVQSYWWPMAKFYPDNSTSTITTAESTYGLTAIFMRRGGNWTIIIIHNNQTLLYTKTGYTGPVAFGMYNQNTLGNTGCSANIVELYKF